MKIKPKSKTTQTSKIKVSLTILIVLFILAWIIASVISLFTEEQAFANVALIPINGVIMPDDSGDMFSSSSVSASWLVTQIDAANKDERIKAVIFQINSNGGAAVASEEVVLAINRLNKTSVALIRDVGASGAYWIAAATDTIFSSSISIVGSVGVLSSGLEFSGLLDDYNVTHNRLVAGEFKDMGSPLKEMTYQEERILQSKIDKIHEHFLNSVAELRSLNESVKEEISSAMIYIGSEGLELGLVDYIGTKIDVVNFLEKKLNISVSIKEYHQQESFFNALSKLTNQKSFSLEAASQNFALEQSPKVFT